MAQLNDTYSIPVLDHSQNFVSGCTHTHSHTPTHRPTHTHTQVVGVKYLSFLLRFGESSVVYIITTKVFTLRNKRTHALMKLGPQNGKLDPHNAKLDPHNGKLGPQSEILCNWNPRMKNSTPRMKNWEHKMKNSAPKVK